MAEPEEISLKDEIGRLAAADPFEPFVIVMVSGERYEIGARDGVAVTGGAIFIATYPAGSHLLRQSQISEVSIPGTP